MRETKTNGASNIEFLSRRKQNASTMISEPQYFQSTVGRNKSRPIISFEKAPGVVVSPRSGYIDGPYPKLTVRWTVSASEKPATMWLWLAEEDIIVRYPRAEYRFPWDRSQCSSAGDGIATQGHNQTGDRRGEEKKVDASGSKFVRIHPNPDTARVALARV